MRAHALAARAGEVLDVLSAARADLDRLGGAPGGPVTIAAVASAALRFVSVAADRLGADMRTSGCGSRSPNRPGPWRCCVAGDVELALVDEYDYVPLALPDGRWAPTRSRQESLVLVDPRAGWGTVRPEPGPGRARGASAG